MEVFKDLFLPPAKSTIADEVDQLFTFVHLSSLVLIVGILTVLIYFLIEYRRKSENEVTPVITHNNALEITWSVIPLIMVLLIFGWGFKLFLNMTTPPDDAYEIHVTARQWFFQFKYENGAQTTGELHVPAGRPVKLIMSSADVIHSFYVPDFRVKQDAVPGRCTSVWFNAPEAGESIIFCAEYCGTGHSDMTGTVVIQEPEEFEKWLANNAGGGEGKPRDLAPAEWGKQLFRQNACNTCHSTDGTRLTGPTWKGIYGSQETMTDGTTVTVDENSPMRRLTQLLNT